MKEIPNRAFASASLKHCDPFPIAQNLADLYADVLEQPLPKELERLIGRLQERMADHGGGERLGS